MAVSVTNLNFAYAGSEIPVLNGIDLDITPGEFVLICGKSGSGKSTLLRLLKREISPAGERSGNIFFKGTPVEQLSDIDSASDIGFVCQNPDNQIVTEYVYSELAFGLENLGYDSGVIRRRVAEMASFFGMGGWFRRNVNHLSGGQKQMLNLAAVMAMQPSLLILDEPTSQLDPIAATDFLETVAKINRELGCTVIITEHRLEDVFSMVDRVVIMDGGRVVSDRPPMEIAADFSENDRKHPMFKAFPAPVRIFAESGALGRCPLTIRDGRRWLSEQLCEKISQDFAEKNPVGKPADTQRIAAAGLVAVSLKDIRFRYQKDLPDVIRDAEFSANYGELYCLLGGNGSGKSTTIKVACGLLRPYTGTVKIDGKPLKAHKSSELFGGILSALPQNPVTVFIADNLLDDLLDAAIGTPEHRREDVEQTAELLGLTALLTRHPFDLSGGEQQKAALAKVLLRHPKIIFLDEPTKGLDAEFKSEFAAILRRLKSDGCAIVMATHDVEFAAEHADRCALFFDGGIVSEDAPARFFSGNNYYTTAANRMTRHECHRLALPPAITVRQAVETFFR